MNDMEKRNLEIYNAITQKLLSQFASDIDKNVVFSPLSILVLLGILADATGSETREEIAKALGSDDNAEEIIEWLTAAQKDLMESGALISSNAVCIREDIKNKIASGYDKHLQDVFDRQGQEMDGTADMLSALYMLWVQEYTGR